MSRRQGSTLAALETNYKMYQALQMGLVAGTVAAVGAQSAAGKTGPSGAIESLAAAMDVSDDGADDGDDGDDDAMAIDGVGSTAATGGGGGGNRRGKVNIQLEKDLDFDAHWRTQRVAPSTNEEIIH